MEKLKRKKIVIKIGSALTLNEIKLNKILDVIEKIKDKCDIIIVASGAVGFGRKKFPSLKDNQALASVGQTTLIYQFEKRFKAAQILVTHDDLSSNKKQKNIKNTINRLLDENIIPIINENDTVSTSELHFGDNDQLSSHIALFCEADEFYSLTESNGILDSKGINMKEMNISKLSKKLIERFEKYCVKDKSNTGTGGIIAKIIATIRATQAGINSFIVNGNKPEILLNLIKKNYNNIGNWTHIIGKMTNSQIREFENYIKEKNKKDDNFHVPAWPYTKNK